MIEGIRQIIDVLIDDKPEEETRLTPERKYELAKFMINKIAELITKISDMINEKKDVTKTTELIVKIYE